MSTHPADAEGKNDIEFRSSTRKHINVLWTKVQPQSSIVSGKSMIQNLPRLLCSLESRNSSFSLSTKLNKVHFFMQKETFGQRIHMRAPCPKATVPSDYFQMNMTRYYIQRVSIFYPLEKNDILHANLS